MSTRDHHSSKLNEAHSFGFEKLNAKRRLRGKIATKVRVIIEIFQNGETVAFASGDKIRNPECLRDLLYFSMTWMILDH